MDWNDLFTKTGKKTPAEIKQVLEKYCFTKTFKIFNVIGTNGKGSTSAFLAQGFESIGKKVGLFTSPHLIRANERIKVNNHDISDRDFERIYNKFKNEDLNFFAFTYVVAMTYFAEQQCDVVILEAGIGGSLDSTNAIDGDWGCITSVSLDHTEILGKTVEEITKDKIGIFNEGMIFYYPSSLPRDLQQIIIEQIPSAIKIENNGETYKERNIKFADEILKLNYINFSNFIFPDGRTQHFKQNGFDVVVDVAHNYDGIAKSMEEIKHLEIDFEQVVITMKKSKDSEGVVILINPKDLFVFQKDDHFYSAEELGGKDLKDVRTFFKNINKNTLFIGSFHLAGEVLDEKNKY